MMSTNALAKKLQLLKQKRKTIRKEDTEYLTALSYAKPKLDKDYEKTHNSLVKEMDIQYFEPLDDEKDILDRAVEITQ